MNALPALVEVLAAFGVPLVLYGFLSLVLVPFRRSEWSAVEQREAVNRVLNEEMKR